MTADPLTSLVSIVIPVYNGARYLGEAIESALAQTYTNIEILVVNDGSTDDGKTESVALSFGDRIRYYHKPNGHVASALNFGIRHMRGEYFSWLSHDDLYKPAKIETQVRAIARFGPKTVVYGDFETLDQSSQTIRPARTEHVSPERFRHWITCTSLMHGCALLIPKLCLEAAGPFNESLRTTQDYDMWFRIARSCRFVHVPGIVVTSREHSEQGTHALRDVVVAELDHLRAGFVRELSKDELKVSTGKTLPSAYTRLAAIMRRQELPLAYEAALTLSLAAAREQPPLRRAVTAVERELTMRLVLLRKKARPLGEAVIRGFRSKSSRGLAMPDVKQRFSEFYRANVFGGREARSGEGSSLEQTAKIREEIPKLLEEIGARTFLDAPCGDLNWMRHVDLGMEEYLGVDVVADLIAENQRRYGNESRRFSCVDLVEGAPPAADVVFCRNCLVHLSFKQAKRVLQNFKRSGSRYLLTTTFTGRKDNVDLKGQDVWRTLNLEMAPFNFPSPLKLINENCTEYGGAYSDKCLGLWRLSDLDVD